MSRFITVNDCINRVAVEVGLTAVSDVFATNDTSFTRLQYLLTTAVQDLMIEYPWQILTRGFQHTTGPSESGDLTLPDDFGYMIPQTGWERSENVPLIGPLSAQDWTYLLGRDLVGSTIYASFRFDQNELRIFPNDPMPEGLDINFEYISRNLIQVAATDPVTYTDEAKAAADIILFPPLLITRLLKCMMLEATGFDSTRARADYEKAFSSWSAKDNSSAILSAGSNRAGFPYLNGYNVPTTNYGV